MIGKLQYEIHNRHAISNVVGIVAMFSSNPKEAHMTVVKRIFRYLEGTKDYGLWYGKNGYSEVKVYIDANWEGNVDERKSINGGAFLLRERLVTWIRKIKLSFHNQLMRQNMLLLQSTYLTLFGSKNYLKG